MRRWRGRAIRSCVSGFEPLRACSRTFVWSILSTFSAYSFCASIRHTRSQGTSALKASEPDRFEGLLPPAGENRRPHRASRARRPPETEPVLRLYRISQGERPDATSMAATAPDAASSKSTRRWPFEHYGRRNGRWISDALCLHARLPNILPSDPSSISPGALIGATINLRGAVSRTADCPLLRGRLPWAVAKLKGQRFGPGQAPPRVLRVRRTRR